MIINAVIVPIIVERDIMFPMILIKQIDARYKSSVHFDFFISLFESKKDVMLIIAAKRNPATSSAHPIP